MMIFQGVYDVISKVVADSAIESMAFSIHFLEACRASQVRDKNCVSSHPYSWPGLLLIER